MFEQTDKIRRPKVSANDRYPSAMKGNYLIRPILWVKAQK